MTWNHRKPPVSGPADAVPPEIAKDCGGRSQFFELIEDRSYHGSDLLIGVEVHSRGQAQVSIGV
jgi:hypothetical protein